VPKRAKTMISKPDIRARDLAHGQQAQSRTRLTY
jgi:hypothetical protein